MSGSVHSNKTFQLCFRQVARVKRPLSNKPSRYPLRPWLLNPRQYDGKSSFRPFHSISTGRESHHESSSEPTSLDKDNASIPFDSKPPESTQASDIELPEAQHIFSSTTQSQLSHEEEPEIEFYAESLEQNGIEGQDLNVSSHSTSGGDGGGDIMFALPISGVPGLKKAKKPRTSQRKERRALARAIQTQSAEGDAAAHVASAENAIPSSQTLQEIVKLYKVDSIPTRRKQSFSSSTVPEPWKVQKAALREKFQDTAWVPRKRLSPDALEGIRALHAQQPEKFTTPVLADHFEVSPEAIRRILKSKWRPSPEEDEDRSRRWDKRGEKIWAALARRGVHPPKKWRDMGIGADTKALRPRERLRMTASASPDTHKTPRSYQAASKLQRRFTPSSTANRKQRTEPRHEIPLIP